MPRLALALCRGYTDIAEVLMHAGDVPVNEEETWKSMLHIAAARGLRTFVSVLLERDADRGLLDEKGLTALDYARGRKNQKMYEYFRLFQHFNSPIELDVLF
jgi:ankyrin repeat protein